MRWFSVVSLLVLHLTFGVSAQFNLGPSGKQPEEKEESFVFAPREQQQKLKRCRESIQSEEFDVGLPLLQELINVESDSFVKGESAGLKSLAFRELQKLSADGLQSHELRMGEEAKAALTTAITANDFRDVDRVARDYYGTRAAAKAAILSARYWIDQGAPESAVKRLRQLAELQVMAPEFQPELSILTANAELQNGQRERAVQVLRKLHQSANSPKSVTLAGKEVAWVTDIEQISAWMDDHLVGQFATASNENEAVDLATLELASAWTSDLSESPEWLRFVERLTAQFESDGRMQALRPIVTSDYVVARAGKKVMAIDAKGGKKVWQYSSIEKKEKTGKLTTKSTVQKRVGMRTQSEEQEFLTVQGRVVLQQIWLDELSSSMSVVGDQLFLLDKWQDSLKFITNDRLMRSRMLGGVQVDQKLEQNRLVAVNLAREGALDWLQQPRKSKDEAEKSTKESLAFVSSRVCESGDYLAFLVREKGDLSLHLSDKKSGEVVWAQPIVTEAATVGTYLRFAERLRPIPFWLVGDTAVMDVLGSLIAVDVRDRMIAWVHNSAEHRIEGEGDSVATDKSPLRILPHNRNDHYRMMRDPTGTRDIVEGKLEELLTKEQQMICGSQSCILLRDGKLSCLDATDGRVRWSKEGVAGWSLAEIANDYVLVSSKTRIAKLDLQTGERLWGGKVVTVPSLGVVCGRGARVGDLYFVPTASKEIGVVDLNSGMTRSFPVHERLGNLGASRDILVSQSPRGVAAWSLAFHQAEEQIDPQADESKDGNDLAEESGQPEPDPTQLVAELGSDSFREREEAQRSLERLGEKARVAIENGLGDLDLEIQHRCRVVLGIIDSDQLTERVNSFLAGKGDLPGWSEFKSILKDKSESRKLYALAYREERVLFDQLGRDSGKVVVLVRDRMSKVIADMRNQQQASVGTTLAMALLTTSKDLREPLLSQKSWLTQVCGLFNHAAARQALTTEGTSDGLKRAVSALADQNLDSGDYTLLSLAQRFDLESKLPLARSLLKKGGKSSSRHYIAQAVNVILEEKSMEDAPLLVSILEDDAVIQTHRDEQRRSYQLQVRDMALAALILLHEKKLEDYGVPIHDNRGMKGMNAKGFLNDEERKKAFAKWNADPISKMNVDESKATDASPDDDADEKPADEESTESDKAAESEKVDKPEAEPEEE